MPPKTPSLEIFNWKQNANFQNQNYALISAYILSRVTLLCGFVNNVKFNYQM